MTTFDASVRSAPSTPAALWLTPSLYAATLFVSALLLFELQPMFAKMVLPRLGGSPSVWSVAMVFFQAALLLGYAYAHLLSRLLTPGRAALVHLGALAVAGLTLPIGIAAGFEVPPESGIALWLIGLFAASIGLPFVTLSASAPLLQNWFAASGHRQADNPYVLYAASNLGSFIALLAYPFAIEPLLPLRQQTSLWSIGFAALAVLIAFCGLLVARCAGSAAPIVAADAPPTSADRLRWVALAAIPSGLVIAVTSFVSADVAAAPFLWVIPLAIYLLTFVAIFRDKPWFDHGKAVALAPLAVAPIAVTLLGIIKTYWLAAIGFNLLAFTILALVCHGELYRRRPAARHLTEFYLFISLGGAIGGACTGLIAPYVFNDVYEYPILLAAALLALPGTFTGGLRPFLRHAGPVLAATVAVVVARAAIGSELPPAADISCKVLAVLLVAFIFLRRKQPAAVFALVVFGFVLTGAWTPGLDRVLTTRSFFGIHHVIDTADGRFRVLMHGTTIHGAELLRADDGTALMGRPEPLTYYYEGGPISETIERTRAAHGGKLDHVAVVGLGAGSLACYRGVAEKWTYYEIDPKVVQIARDPRMFTFLSACASTMPIVLGDARLTLAASSTRYDLIILDAFSSDTIPVHLLTEEAFAIYLAHLTPHGVLVIHGSNRHLDLIPVVAAAAKAANLVALLKEVGKGEPMSDHFKAGSSVMAMARDTADVNALMTEDGWRRLDPIAGIGAWTDDYSNVLGALIRRKLGS
jgi:spermidine synthase